MKLSLKLEHWLALSFFGLNLVFIIVIFVSLYTQLKSSLLERTENQLHSISILKEKLIESYLHDKTGEALHTIHYFQAHQERYDDLIERLEVIEDVTAVYIQDTLGIHQYPEHMSRLLTFPKERELQVGALPVEFTEDSTSFYVLLNEEAFSVMLLFSIRGLQDILMERSGMGATGESYLVTPDHRMRTVSRFFPDTLPNAIVVHTLGVEKALDGDEGIATYPDYRDVLIIGAYRPVRFAGLHWALLTEIDFAEAMSPVITIRDRFIGLSLLLMLASLACSVILAKQLSRPILGLREKILQLAEGVLPKTQSKPVTMVEINQISEAINRLIVALRRTATFARHIGEGDFAAHYDLLSVKDEMGLSILRMRKQLVQLNEQNARLERETKKVLVNAQEQERERIARDMHDGIGPLLTTARLKIAAFDVPDTLKQELLQLIDDTITEIRRVSRNLMPAVLMDFGPGEALAILVDDLRKSVGIDIQYINELFSENSQLGKEKGIALYRIAQEALNNAIKHSCATTIKMSVTEFEDHVDFYIRDNGKGFDPHHKTAGDGLRNIRERVLILNGTIHIDTGNQGTTIEIELPIKDD